MTRTHHRRQDDRGGAARQGRPTPCIVCAATAASCPGLAVVLVGDNPASEVYVRNKSKAVAEAGMRAVRPQAAGDTSAKPSCSR